MSTTTINIKTENQLVPALRFKGFEGGIKETLFGNHYSFHTTNSFSRDKLNYDRGEVRNIHYGDIHTKFQTHFHLANEYVPLINDDVDLAKIKEDSYCKVGDLVIADASEDYADIGKSIELIDINNEKLLAGLHTFLARPSSESIALGYISCLLKSWKLRKQIMTIAQGTKVLSLSAGRVSNLKLNLPSLPEQQKIASFLSAVDEKIQQLTKKKALLEQYKKSVMQQLFSGQLRFKDENGNSYPDWEEKLLGEICDYKNGGSFENLVVNDGEFNLITLNSIDINGKLKSNHKKVTKSDNSLLEGDLIMVLSDVAHGNFLGLSDIIPDDSYVLNQRMGALKPKIKLIRIYLKTFINHNQKYFKLMGQGSSQQNLSKGDVLNFNVLFPIIEEQQKIATYLSSIDTKIESVTNQITQTQTFKKGLLQQMFV